MQNSFQVRISQLLAVFNWFKPLNEKRSNNIKYSIGIFSFIKIHQVKSIPFCLSSNSVDTSDFGRKNSPNESN